MRSLGKKVNVLIPLIILIWWILQGLLLMWRGWTLLHIEKDISVWIMIIGGLNLLSALFLFSKKNKAVLIALLYFTLYSLAFLTLVLLLIAVGSPDSYFVWILFIIESFNIYFLIKGYQINKTNLR